MKQIHPGDAFLLGYLLEVNQTADGWQRFMEALVEHFGLRSSTLMVINPRTLAVRFHVDGGTQTSPEYAESYIEKYVYTDVLMNTVISNPSNQFLATNLLPESLAAYQCASQLEWADPQGIGDSAAACVFSEGDWSCILFNNRRKVQGPYKEEEIQRLNALLPFVEKAVQSSFLLNQRSQDQLRARSLVNNFRIPVVVLTEYGEVWAMNDSMKEIVDNSSDLYIEHKNLRLRQPDKDKQLTTGIVQAIKRATGFEMRVEQAEKILVNEHITLGFQELREYDELTGDVFLGALVFAFSSNLIRPMPPNRLKELFGLTPTEAQVCHLLSDGYGIKSIAMVEDKSVSTVREQVNNIFQKTGTTSQVSLINLLASLPG
ncbi:helix-turn-helix transcriptional regulator [Litoribrevibacter albus]|uniref:HTH luxR-type domain-containing protein n=1 Tax=Litoribrevibacter albus TaxID=1473156 RepID=A0AA37SCS5_9GAMM|nr:helix-turn-helix transcriptional regulator [Litoribrevibacter albus]GLQ33069.1 hypothetical protein GCM10007876_35480 [Litoribrevibacter albus]